MNEIEIEVDQIDVILQGHELTTNFHGVVTFNPKKQVLRIEQFGKWNAWRRQYERLDVCPKLSRDLYQALEAGFLSAYAQEIDDAIYDWAVESGEYVDRHEAMFPPRRIRDYI